MTAEPVVEWLADSSLLICFGALPRGGNLLIKAYGHTVGVTPTVRWEMNRIADSDARQRRGIASSAFTGRHASKVHDVVFQRRDEHERQTARDHIAQRQVPVDPPAALDETEAGMSDGSAPWQKQHAGEAETIAVAVRTQQGVLMTDVGGRNYAEARGLEVHSFTHGFSRLIGSIPARQMYQMWLDVNRQHFTGPEVVHGQSDFRTPPRSR